MGGCSSKPKTTECEGAMDVQEEDKLQDESARKSTEIQSTSIDAGLKEGGREHERALQNSIVQQKDKEDFQECFSKTQKQPFSCLSPGPETEGQILEGISKASNSGDRNVPSNDRENEKLDHKLPASTLESQHLVKELRETQQLVKELVETPVIQETATDNTGTIQTEKVAEGEGILNNVEDGSEPSVKSVCPEDQTSELHEGHMVQGEETVMFLSSPLEDANSKPKKESMVEQSQDSQPQDLSVDKKHVKLVEISEHDDDENRTDSKECEQMCNGNGGTYEEDKATEVVKKVTEFVIEDKGTSEVNKEYLGGQSGVLITAYSGPENMEELTTSRIIVFAEGANSHEQPMQVQDASLVEDINDVDHGIPTESSAELTAAQCALPVVSEDLWPVPVLDIQLVDAVLLKHAFSQVADSASGGSEQSLINVVVKDGNLPPTTKTCEELQHIEVANDKFDEFHLEKSGIGFPPNEGALKGVICLTTAPKVVECSIEGESILSRENGIVIRVQAF